MQRDCNDIKAPDGYLLGGYRLVRRDGSILFQRGYWSIPDDYIQEFAGMKVWVHEAWLWASSGGERLCLEVAHPGLHIYEARTANMTVFAERNNRPDAKSGARLKWRKDWESR